MQVNMVTKDAHVKNISRKRLKALTMNEPR